MNNPPPLEAQQGVSYSARRPPTSGFPAIRQSALSCSAPIWTPEFARAALAPLSRGLGGDGQLEEQKTANRQTDREMIQCLGTEDYRIQNIYRITGQILMHPSILAAPMEDTTTACTRPPAPQRCPDVASWRGRWDIARKTNLYLSARGTCGRLSRAHACCRRRARRRGRAWCRGPRDWCNFPRNAELR